MSDKEDKEDNSGIRLTQDEIKRVAKHFNDHIGDRSCHICGTRKWNPLPSVYTSVLFDRKKNHHRVDRVVPQVSVACLKCGAITNFFAAKAGIEHRLTDDEDDAS